jgi:Co/Zn/Cd efflux system component
MERSYRKHQHVFHVPKKEAEGRMLLVFLLTLAFMFVEIASGYIFGSVALLAEGIHILYAGKKVVYCADFVDKNI